MINLNLPKFYQHFSSLLHSLSALNLVEFVWARAYINIPTLFFSVAITFLNLSQFPNRIIISQSVHDSLMDQESKKPTSNKIKLCWH